LKKKFFILTVIFFNICLFQRSFFFFFKKCFNLNKTIFSPIIIPSTKVYFSFDLCFFFFFFYRLVFFFKSRYFLFKMLNDDSDADLKIITGATKEEDQSTHKFEEMKR
jgi:hypothetical protein